MYYRFLIGLLVALTVVAVAAGAYASEGGEKVDLNPLAKFQTDLALWTGVVFLVLLAILWKFAWGPIAAGLEKREHGIADQIALAETANRQAQELLGQYEQRLADAKDDVRGILEQARRDAERVGQELVDKAKEEAATEHQRALKRIDTATAVAMKEIADQAAELAVDLAGKIVRAKLTPADHAKLIEQAVADFTRSKN